MAAPGQKTWPETLLSCPLSPFFNLKSKINMPKYTPVTCGDGAVLVRQNPAPLTHAGSFLGLALDQSESMNTLAGVAIDSINYLPRRARVCRRSICWSDCNGSGITLVPLMKEPVGDLIVGEQVRRPVVLARQVSNAGRIDLLRVLGFVADG
jgi:hypothetical protein